MTRIGNSAFYNCHRLTSIICEASTPPRSFSSFDSKSIPVYVPANSIEAYKVAYGWKDFTNIQAIVQWKLSDDGTLTISGTDMPNYYRPWYSQIDKIKKVIIEEGMTNIGKSAFEHCHNLTSITIPETVTSIGDFAFAGCWSLTSVTIPNSATSIGSSAFYECTSLKDITIGNSVTSIGNRAFYNCSGLTSITIPNSVTSIERSVFEGCSGLTSVTIPNSVTSIGSIAFRYCSSLTSITIPNSVISIKSEAFLGCTSLTSVTIPESVTSIGEEAFYGCSGLTSITCEASTPPNCSYIRIFFNVNKSIPVYVPANSVDAYKKANVWKDFTNIQTIPDNQKIADAVVVMINAIGKVEYTDACKDKIDEAYNAYNALTADQKTFVTNLEVLTKAQQTYDNLRAAAEKLIADKAAFNKYKSEIIAIIEALVKDDDSDAVKEIIKKAISNIEAFEYDVAISLDDNKAKIQSFATSTDEAVESQRAEDQKTNGIEELEFAEKYNIYDLNGRKITNSILKSGLYIRNGKKMVVK